MRRLTILFAAVAACLLIPTAQAAMAGTLKVNIEGDGSGEISSVGGFEGIEGFYEGHPPIECTYKSPGPAIGVCEDELSNEGEGILGVALYSHPDPGSKMVAWIIEEGDQLSGCGEFTLDNCAVGSFSEEGNAEVTAIFECEVEGTCEGGEEIPNLKLNVEEGEGTVVSNPAGLTCSKAAPGSCEAAVAEGPVVLTASPAPGYAFKGWKGCDTGGAIGRQCTVTATSSLKSVGVKFYKVWNLAMSKSNGNGIASTSPGGVNCGYGCLSSAADYKPGSVTLKAKPAKNFHFVEFKGGTGSASSCNGVSAETCTITIGEDSSIEEVYAENAKNTLTITKTGGGQAFVKTKPTNVNCGYTCGSATAEFFAAETAVPVTVALNKGTTSVTWSGGTGGTTCTSNQLTCTVDMSSNQTLTAEFK